MIELLPVVNLTFHYFFLECFVWQDTLSKSINSISHALDVSTSDNNQIKERIFLRMISILFLLGDSQFNQTERS